MHALQQALADDPRVAYALLFGSSARDAAHEGSDLDVAIAFRAGVTIDTLDFRPIEELAARGVLSAAAHGP